MEKVKVLIVDDSAFFRQRIRTLFESNEDFEVVGIARNGEDALIKAENLKPDVITMDIKMEKMNGIDALKRIMKSNPIPVVMISEFVEKGAKYTVEALQNGAVDCILKSEIIGNSANRDDVAVFFEKIKIATKANMKIMDFKESEPIVPKINIPHSEKKDIEMVFIGCSTGGPNALREILLKIPESFDLPILVAQHMPKGFTTSLASGFHKTCNLPVKEVEHGEVVKKGKIYIAPSGYQTTLLKKGSEYVFCVEDNEKVGALYSPAVDITLQSLVPIYKEKLLVVILTGMGQDGLKGCKEVKEHDGYIMTQTKETCIVYGMPRAVDEAGLSDEKVSLYEIYQRILSIAKK